MLKLFKAKKIGKNDFKLYYDGILLKREIYLFII